RRGSTSGEAPTINLIGFVGHSAACANRETPQSSTPATTVPNAIPRIDTRRKCDECIVIFFAFALLLRSRVVFNTPRRATRKRSCRAYPIGCSRRGWFRAALPCHLP